MEPTAKQTVEERQAMLDVLTDEDIASVYQNVGTGQSAIQVDDEWLILAEFAKHFGWQAYKDARNDKVKTDEMMTLIAAARKLDHLTLYNNARAVFIGSGAAQAKKPSESFKKMTEKIVSAIQADV